MRDERKFGAEARSNQELPEQTQLDIMKVLEQCGIHPDNWKRFVQTDGEGDGLAEISQIVSGGFT
ncbi:hypothetical protein [Paenibacillus sp. OAE614]|uniref:hypothetical protein n=1 Tax=Paenibacillus sp. OAE614 TaxID=2663804 RepID=UPI0033925771